MTKAAFATWNDRIAPVFDVARSVRIVEIKDGRIIGQTQADVAGEMPNQRASCVAALKVRTLVCGAISRPLQAVIRAYGIEVIPFVAGNLQEVIQAWLGGKLDGSAEYIMPGCRNAGRRRFQGLHQTKGRESQLNTNRQGQRGAGQRSGAGRQGQGRKGRGKGGGTRSAGAGPGSTASLGTCVCPQCGHTEPHERGVPCMQKKCAQCGTPMNRQ